MNDNNSLKRVQIFGNLKSQGNIGMENKPLVTFNLPQTNESDIEKNQLPRNIQKFRKKIVENKSIGRSIFTKQNDDILI